MEIDDIYFGGSEDRLDYVLPVRAKGLREPMSILQLRSDALFCRQVHPDLTCRMIGVKRERDYVAIFVCALSPTDEVEVLEEAHLKDPVMSAEDGHS